MKNNFNGVMPPIITPFKPNFELDKSSLRELIEFWIEGGVHGLIPTGSTGEFARLTISELKNVIKIVVDQTNGRVPVLAGTASTSTQLTIELSKFAEDVGADGLQIVPPFYGTLTDEEIYQHYKAVAEAVDIPIAAYNNPITSGNDISPMILARLSELDNIHYVKEASGDTKRVHEIIRRTNGRLTVFGGCDDNMFEAMALGAKGWVAGIANITPSMCRELYELTVEKNDLEKARTLYYKLLPLGVIIESRGRFFQFIKAGIEMLGYSAGPPRPPLLPLSKTEQNELQGLLTRLNIL